MSVTTAAQYVIMGIGLVIVADVIALPWIWGVGLVARVLHGRFDKNGGV